jgi:hypothetical protein
MRKALYGASMVAVGTVLGSVLPALAQTKSPSSRMLNKVGDLAEKSGQKRPTGQDLPVIIGSYIQTLISLLGVVLLVYLLYGGFLWMTAQGEEKQVDKARAIIKNAVIGMVVISLSYAISAFVLSAIVETQVTGGLAVPE